MNIKKHLDLLGFEVQDKATDFKGVVNSVSFDLFGCIQADVRPKELNKEGELNKGYWLDINRLKKISKKPVMEAPNFEYGYVADSKQGAADKPTRR